MEAARHLTPEKEEDRYDVPIVSVIMLNWNGARWLPRCLESLQATDYPRLEIVVADNGSIDESIDLLRLYSRVRVISFGHNLGYARANNLAAIEAKGSFLLFLNNDTWLESDAISALVNEVTAHRDAGFCAAKMCEYNSSVSVNNGILLDIFGYPVPYEIRAPTDRMLFYADGAALFVRAEIFRALGGFDEGHFILAEDSDLCWRGALLGFRTVRAPRARIHHYGGGTLHYANHSREKVVTGQWTTNKYRRFLSERNILVNILKNYSAKTLFWILPLFFLVNSLEAAILVLRQRDRSILGTYLEAWAEAMRRLPQTLRSRRSIQRERVVSDQSILLRMHWSYSKGQLALMRGIPHFE